MLRTPTLAAGLVQRARIVLLAAVHPDRKAPEDP